MNEVASGDSSGQDEWKRFVRNRMNRLLARWQRTGAYPEDDAPSKFESWALALASGNEQLLQKPLLCFLCLDSTLQAWVLEARGWQHLIGTRIGA